VEGEPAGAVDAVSGVLVLSEVRRFMVGRSGSSEEVVAGSVVDAVVVESLPEEVVLSGV
jgi:hypothetical protein